jgi:MFS transporter, SP family, inositol transporter
MKVWAQESFPTLLRSTAQGTIIAAARVFAAVLALVTPNLIDGGPRVLFGTLAAFIAIGMGAAVWGFRRGTRNEFDVEDEIVEPALAR